MANNTSQHILGTASNLLGFCLVITTSIKVSTWKDKTLIDEFTGLAALFLIACCIFSFLSLRTSREKVEKRLETIAEWLFFIALILIFIAIIYFSVNVI